MPAQKDFLIFADKNFEKTYFKGKKKGTSPQSSQN